MVTMYTADHVYRADGQLCGLTKKKEKRTSLIGHFSLRKRTD